MTTYLTVRCDWCETEKTFVDEDPVDEGWLRVETSQPESDGIIQREYCSTECLIADL